MVTKSNALARAARIGLGACAVAMALPVLSVSSPAFAQSASCGEIQKFLLERKSIASSLAPKKGKQLDAGFACSGFGRLVSNGNVLIKWVTVNKDWCQIPDQFVSGIKEDHSRATAIRAKACGIMAKQAEMDKKAKTNQDAGLLGGGGLEGPTRLPQGAL